MRVKIFSLILMFFFLFGLYSQEGEWWVGKTIKSIDFDGLVNISKSDLDGITKPYKGQVFTYELYQELLGALFALDYFDNIETAAVKGDDNYNTVKFTGRYNGERVGYIIDHLSKVNLPIDFEFMPDFELKETLLSEQSDMKRKNFVYISDDNFNAPSWNDKENWEDQRLDAFEGDESNYWNIE